MFLNVMVICSQTNVWVEKQVKPPLAQYTQALGPEYDTHHILLPGVATWDSM